MNKISRRSFVKTASLGTAGVLLGVHGTASAQGNPAQAGKKETDKVRLACVGIANRGAQVIRDFEKTGLSEIVALCDVDIKQKQAQEVIARYPKAKCFTDFRELFEKYHPHFDAVCICVPDFAHFPVSMLALSYGKHVFVEKPMARTFHECELLMNMARRHPELATQVGNQGHSQENYFQFKAWMEAGIIKDVYAIVAHHNDWRRWHPYDHAIYK